MDEDFGDEQELDTLVARITDRLLELTSRRDWLVASRLSSVPTGTHKLLLQYGDTSLNGAGGFASEWADADLDRIVQNFGECLQVSYRNLPLSGKAYRDTMTMNMPF